MRATRRGRSWVLVLFGTGLLVVIAAAVAGAAIPGPGGVISACYKVKGSANADGDGNGALRVIDPSTGETCKKNERLLTWNEQGQGTPGPAGPPGPTGLAGPQGPQGPAGGGNDRPPFAGVTLEGAGDVGHHSSIAIGADGLGLISYFEERDANEVTQDLKVAHCSNTACTAATRTTLVGSGPRGTNSSLTIGSDGLGLISYFANGIGLEVAHCTNVICSSATTSLVDGGSAATGIFGTSITIGADGLGLISYHDGIAGDLEVAHCSNLACTSATITTVDSVGIVGRFSSVTIGADGLGLISYHDETNRDLKVAHCSNTACTAATTTTVDSDQQVGLDTSITVGKDGLGLISYSHGGFGQLKVAHCSNTACSAVTATTHDTGLVSDTSLTLGPDGHGLIAYQQFDFGLAKRRLKVAHCSEASCTTSTTSVLDEELVIPEFGTSITTGVDGFGLISYQDGSNLRVVHLSNTLGIPFFRRR